MATSERVNTSTQTEKIDTMGFNAWTLTFNYKFSEGQVPTIVNITGVNGTSGFMNFSRSAANTSVSFNGTNYDFDLIQALAHEADIIIATPTPVADGN